MSLAEIFHALQETAPAVAFRESAWVYPIVLSLHLTCIAIFGAMIAVTNLRLLGWIMPGIPFSQLYLALRPWKRAGFVIMMICGLLLAGSEADKYYPNPLFWTKMVLLSLVLVHYVLFRGPVFSNPRALDAGITKTAKIAAVSSLAIWLGIMSMGRWIAYWEPPDEKPPVTSQVR